MAAEFDRRRFAADWREMADPERAVASAHDLFRAVRDGKVDPVPLLDDLELAAEAAWDGPGGDPKLVIDALLKARSAFHAAQSGAEAGAALRVQLRFRHWLLLARAWLRYGHPRQALIECLAALRGLEDLAGGRVALRDVVARPANPVGEMAVGFLGLFPAALRRANLAPTHRPQFHAIGFELLRAYLGPKYSPTIYPRTAAVAAQWFFYLVHDPDADDELIKALFRLDERTRPRDARGLATWDSLAMEYEKRFGTPLAAERHRLAALASLARLPLSRHRKVVGDQGYLDPPDNPS